MLQRFHGGSPSVRHKLNAAVDELNPLTVIRGDEQFIAVKRGPGGSLVSLNIAAVLARVPKRAMASVLVEFTSAAGGGKYNARIVVGLPDPTADPSDNLSMPEGMTIPDADNCIVYNLLESTTNRVVLNHTYLGELRGVLDDGTPIVFVNLINGVEAVKLETDGGSNASTPTGVATYTYTVKTPDGAVTLATGVSPEGNREQGILTGPATIGQVRFAPADGSMHLIQCDEKAAVIACP